MQKLLPTTLLLVIVSIASAQQLPLFTQYVFDPYLINPSMVASTGKPEVNLLYRRQWAKIEDGPKLVQFDAQMPLNQKMAVGINVYNDKTVLLTASSVLLSYAYKVQLAPDHSLGFGISGGIYSNRIRTEDVAPIDATDPALLNTASNNMSLNGQFGTHYKFKNFTLGFSLVNLVERKAFSDEKFQKTKFGQLKNEIIFASYRFEVVPNTWYVQPNVAYRLSQDNINYVEASALVSYKNLVDVGGGYRQGFGPSGMLRLHMKNLSVGFAYDLYSNKAQVSPGGTQEIQVKWRFGKNDETSPRGLKKNSTPNQYTEEKLQSKPEKETVEPVKEEPKPQPIAPKEEPVREEPKPEVIVPKVERSQPEVVVEPKVETKTEPEPVKPIVTEQPKTPEVNADELYFVIGTFENRANAEQFSDLARKKGVQVEIKESKPGVLPKYFYVHVPKYKSKDVTVDKVLELQKTTGFKDAWFTKIDE